MIRHTEKFHFLPCTEKIVSAGKTWRRDGRFSLRTLITICSFPDNNRKKMHESPLKWNRLSFPSPSRFCSAEDGSLFHRQHAAAVLITESVIIGGSARCTGCIAEGRKRRGLRSNSPTFVSLSFSPSGRICILMEGFYRLLVAFVAPQVASLSELSRIRGDAEVRYPYAITEPKLFLQD